MYISFHSVKGVDLERDMVVGVQNGGLFVHDLIVPALVVQAGNAFHKGAPQRTELHKTAAGTLRPRRCTGEGNDVR